MKSLHNSLEQSPLHATQATKHSRLGSFSEIGVPTPHLMEMNIYRVRYIHYNTGMTSLGQKIKLYISLLFLGSNLIIS